MHPRAGQAIPTFSCFTTEDELMKSELALPSIFSIDMAFVSNVLWSTDWQVRRVSLVEYAAAAYRPYCG
jgi:hypothetical protein